MGRIFPKTWKVGRVELCGCVRFGQVPLAPLCPFSTTQAPRGSGVSGHALCGAQAALNSRLPRWEATGGPSQRELPAPAGPEVNRTPAPQTSQATRTGRARSPRPDPQGGGARLPAAEARTFTPTFCFASALGSRPRHWFSTAWGRCPLRPEVSTSCSEN